MSHILTYSGGVSEGLFPVVSFCRVLCWFSLELAFRFFLFLLLIEFFFWLAENGPSVQVQPSSNAQLLGDQNMDSALSPEIIDNIHVKHVKML